MTVYIIALLTHQKRQKNKNKHASNMSKTSYAVSSRSLTTQTLSKLFFFSFRGMKGHHGPALASCLEFGCLLLRLNSCFVRLELVVQADRLPPPPQNVTSNSSLPSSNAAASDLVAEVQAGTDRLPACLLPLWAVGVCYCWVLACAAA